MFIIYQSLSAKDLIFFSLKTDKRPKTKIAAAIKNNCFKYFFLGVRMYALFHAEITFKTSKH